MNAFNSFKANEEYSINKIKEKTGLHWETIHDYIVLTKLFDEFCPQIEFNPKTKKVKISQPSKSLLKRNFEDQMIVYLFTERIFDDETSCEIKKIKINPSKEDIEKYKTSKYFEFALNKSASIYLTKSGKFKAQGILSSLHGEMSDFLDKKADTEAEDTTYEILLPFQQKLSSDAKINHIMNDLGNFFSIK
jgi:hypothetical protein